MASNLILPGLGGTPVNLAPEPIARTIALFPGRLAGALRHLLPAAGTGCKIETEQSAGVVLGWAIYVGDTSVTPAVVIKHTTTVEDAAPILRNPEPLAEVLAYKVTAALLARTPAQGEG